MSQQLFTMYSSTSTRGTLQGKESSLGFPKALLHACEPPKTIQVCVLVCVCVVLAALCTVLALTYQMNSHM